MKKKTKQKQKQKTKGQTTTLNTKDRATRNPLKYGR
jgi:hypothetical protein